MARFEVDNDSLLKRVRELEEENASLRESQKVFMRPAIEKMSAEVKDTNPYR